MIYFIGRYDDFRHRTGRPHAKSLVEGTRHINCQSYSRYGYSGLRCLRWRCTHRFGVSLNHCFGIPVSPKRDGGGLSRALHRALHFFRTTAYPAGSPFCVIPCVLPLPAVMVRLKSHAYVFDCDRRPTPHPGFSLCRLQSPPFHFHCSTDLIATQRFTTLSVPAGSVVRIVR